MRGAHVKSGVVGALLVAALAGGVTAVAAPAAQASPLPSKYYSPKQRKALLPRIYFGESDLSDGDLPSLVSPVPEQASSEKLVNSDQRKATGTTVTEKLKKARQAVVGWYRKLIKWVSRLLERLGIPGFKRYGNRERDELLSSLKREEMVLANEEKYTSGYDHIKIYKPKYGSGAEESIGSHVAQQSPTMISADSASKFKVFPGETTGRNLHSGMSGLSRGTRMIVQSRVKRNRSRSLGVLGH